MEIDSCMACESD